MTTPEPVSPAPDTEALRAEIRRTVGGDFQARLIAADLLDDDDVLSVLRVFEDIVPTIAEREAGLRADLDQARDTSGEAVVRQNVLRAERDALSRMLRGMARQAVSYRQGWSKTLRDWADEDQEAVAALRVRVSGARPIPDDAAERAALRMFRVHVYGTLTSERHDASARNQWVKVLDEDDRETWRKLARELLADLGATPTTDPAPAAAGRPRWVQRGLHHHRCAARAGAADCTCGVEPAAPQAPAEPTEETAFGALLAAAGDLDGGTDADRRLAEHIRSAVAEVAREDAATPPLPLHEQADLLTWRVVHVPPGTTDREDTDTPITPGWWLVGHGDDPDHPDVQVHLGDRLPTSSAATPAGGSHEVEVTVQDDGWATAECRTCTASIGESAEDTVQDWADRHRADTLRPGSLTPIQPEEA